MVLPKLVGKSVRRKEDPRFITGRGRYLDDISLPGLLHARFVRSPYPHATIRRIDSSRALKMEGVVMVLTGQDIAALCRTGIPTAKLPPGSKLPSRFPLAMREVNYVGEPVALLVADSKYIARDASDLIEVEYEPIEHVIDPEAALKQGSVRVHEEFSDNVAYHSRRRKGNVERAFGESAKVLRRTFRIPRMASIPLEPRGILASYDRGSEFLSIWIGTQGPHHIRTWYSEYLGLPQNRVRVVAPDMGGGFGCKLEIYSDELAVCIAALRLGRPVKWIQERMEDLMTTNHGRGQIHKVEVGVREDGKLLGLRDRIVADYGAYLHIGTIITTQATEEMITGAYHIENVDIDTYGVFTNKMTHDAFRGAGVPEANYVIERMVDEAARALDLDPAAVRMRNFVRPDQFPYTNATGTTYDNGDYAAGLRRALELVEYERMRKEQQEKKKNPENGGNNRRQLMGIGLASYVQIGGFGPSRDSADRVAGYESARVRVDPDGRVTLYTGSAPQGQGLETVLAQIVADELQVAIDDVTVIHGDTESVPYGVGTYGSRSAVVSGHSVLMACNRIRDKSLRIAAQLFEARLDDIEFEDGRFYVKGSPSRALSLREIASEATFMKNLPASFEPVLDSTAHYDPDKLTFAFGTHASIVDVDSETGVVKVIKYVGVDDCGRVLNPMIVEGQMHGGIIQGLGEALYEEIRYDENGQLLTATLMDYTIPGVTESPEMILERTETPADSPLGLKGIGEAGTTVATPAILNAIADALGTHGATITTLPARSEVVWSSLTKRMNDDERVSPEDRGLLKGE